MKLLLRPWHGAVIATLLTLGAATTIRADTQSGFFGYDSNGRLAIHNLGASRCDFYAYDANGNRTSQQTIVTPAEVPVWGSVAWGAFSYSAAPAKAIWGSGSWGCLSWTAP